MSSNSTLSVIVKLKNNNLGIPVHLVSEMVRMPEVTALPTGLSHARGIITIRKKAIPVIDLRTLFDLETLREEDRALINLMTEREADHVNWLRELENSVNENKAFTLATDPHKCNFGKWYDNFTTDHLMLGSTLAKFDSPHKKIHGIAENVLALAANGQQEQAKQIIEETRDNELSAMIQLFGRARDVIKNDSREMVLILDLSGFLLGLAVDAIVSVEDLEEQENEEVPEMLQQTGNGFFHGIAESRVNQRMVLLLDTNRLLSAGQSLREAV